MLCDNCGKNEATVHFTEIINNQMREMHLCEECAERQGEAVQGPFSIAEMLAHLADFDKSVPEGVASGLKCAKCGMNYDDFRRIGRLGCGECYNSFRKNLMPLLRRIHGSTRHFGKAPMKTGVPAPAATARRVTAKAKALGFAEKPEASELDILKAKLTRAIETEEFEEAARLRDKIRILERRKSEGKGDSAK